jgi:SEC-C motif-containing protein
LAQQQLAATPEALMRSRYSAYVRADEVYLRATWHPRTCPQGPLLDTEPGLKWLGLEVKAASLDASGEAGTVEFVARYKVAGRARRLHEVSRFVREDGRWWYLDGQFPDEAGAAGRTAVKT